MTETAPADALIQLSKFKLKENVRDQHRKILRWQLIGVVIWMVCGNLAFLWGVLNSKFDERMIGAVGVGTFIIFFLLVNLAMCLGPLLYLNSNVYRAKIPDKIKKGVEGMYAAGDDDETKDTWEIALETEIGGLPY